MQNVSDGEGPHPDLRELVYTELVRLAERSRPEQRAAFEPPASADQLTFACQRTWHDITTLNARLACASFSACVAQFEQAGDRYSYFVEAARSAGQETWGCAGMQGGKQPTSRADAGGFMLVGGSHVCVGGLGMVPEDGLLRVEMADGSNYASAVADSCAIVFAPVTTPPGPEDHVVVRVLDGNGVELSADRVRLGDGSPPPGVRPAPGGDV